jgi:hypothetical protein
MEPHGRKKMKKTLLATTVLVTMLAIASLSLPVSANVSGDGRKVTFNLDVPYHPEAIGGFCGAAVAQMWIDYNTGTSVDQWELFYGDPDGPWDGIYMNNPEPGWWTSPQGLEVAMNWYVQPTDPATIADYSYDNPYVAVAYQAISIIFYNQPSAALVWDGDHWMLVKGVVLQLNPMVIKGFYVHDPYGFQEGWGFPGPDVFKTVKAWVNAHFTPTIGGEIWHGKWVTVEYHPEATHPTGFVQGFSYTIEIESSRGEPTTFKDVVNEAQRGLSENGLYDSDSFGSRLKGAKATFPIRVQSLSENLNDYYIVPFEKGGKISAAAIVDAVTGDFLEATCGFATTADYLMISNNQAEEIIQKYIGKELAGPLELVWMPCSHSWQPYYPFWLGVTVDGDQIFVDMNGVPFEA